MNTDTDRLLAVESSLDICSVALFRDSLLAEEHVFRHNMHLSERLISSIDAILKVSKLEIVQIDAFAVGIGPGSFTGTRIGVMTVKMLASLIDKPVVGVGSLEAIAMRYSGLEDTLIVPMLPCRSGIVYTAAYAVDKEQQTCFIEPSALTISELTAKITNLLPKKIVFCGKSANRFEEELRIALHSFNLSFGSHLYADAEEVGRIALERLHSGRPITAAIDLVPDYISPPPITMPKVPIPIDKKSHLSGTQ